MEGRRKIKWNVNEKNNHHTLNIMDGLGNSVTLYNDELDTFYDILSGILVQRMKKDNV